MDRQKIMDQLIIDEGKRLDVYRDSLGLLTVGVGHLILKGDAIPEGSTISEDRCQQLLEHDLDHAIVNSNMMFPGLPDRYPEEIQEVIINLVFNMGPTRLLGFKKFIMAIKTHNWQDAADELQNSKWYGQVGPRADRLIAMVDSCADEGMS